MRVEMRVGNVDWSATLTSYVERRLKFALGRFGGRVGRVIVRVGTTAPSENYCRISAEILPFGHVGVHEKDPDLFAATDRATRRLDRLFGRELARVRESKTGRESIRLAA